MQHRAVLVCLLSSLLGACTGAISDGRSSAPGSGSPASGSPGSSNPGGGGSNPGSTAADFPLPSGAGAQPRLWRLTAAQYQNAVKDLLNVTVTTPLPSEDEAGAFGNRANLLDVSPALLEAYADAAEEVANQVMPHLGTLLTCQPLNAASPACVEPFIRSFGARAWRRPLDAAEVASLLKLHADLTARFDGNAGVSAVLQAFLISPKFVFRSEVGDPMAGSKTRRLTPFEVATALAFTLWNTTPDAPLMNAATIGKLTAPTDIQAMARTMLGDARAQETTTNFVERWLGIQTVETNLKSAKLFPAYSPALMQAMAAQARLSVGGTLWNDKSGVRELLTGSTTFVDRQTAPLYGLPAAMATTTPQAVALDPTQRLGILTQLAFLAAHASEDASKPVLRGQFVRENILCQDVPPPPPDVKIDDVMGASSLTARQRFTMHATNPACATCHKMFDGLGFAFENYDALGAYRTMDNGLPVDASGTLVDVSGTETPFHNALDLVRILGGSEQTYRCFAQRLFESFGGRPAVQSDVSDLARAHAAFHDGGYNVKNLLAALTVSDGFLIRQAN
jgi:hypothetical protein